MADSDDTEAAKLTAGVLGSSGPNLHRWTQMRDLTYINIILRTSPKNPLKHLKTIKGFMQRRAEQGTFDGRFGGRKSLQS